ncbi:MAG: hypothetical protein GX889_01940 [Clostridiales bacterium]|nr:hypothetical protein [Clostridiales bacterium]
MVNIFIDINKREVSFRDDKLRLIKRYSNISTKNKEDLDKTTRLFIYALNKIFLNRFYYDENYMFYVNNKEIIDLIKTENNNFLRRINKNWHKTLTKDTISQLGNFLSLFNRIKNKNLLYWENKELYEIIDKKEKLYQLQSECDIKIQDILHQIQKLPNEEIVEDICIKLILEIKNLRLERSKIKNKIKLLEKKEKKLINN